MFQKGLAGKEDLVPAVSAQGWHTILKARNKECNHFVKITTYTKLLFPSPQNFKEIIIKSGLLYTYFKSSNYLPELLSQALLKETSHLSIEREHMWLSCWLCLLRKSQYKINLSCSSKSVKTYWEKPNCSLRKYFQVLLLTKLPTLCQSCL